jgi:hypothetical protein
MQMPIVGSGICRNTKLAPAVAEKCALGEAATRHA